jgi:NAD(P)-dependent dehydrogenase (short-subunit alcohol dehydrogenase family)
VAEVITQAGRIDALVSNAGIIGPAAALEEIGLDQARAIFEVNFFGAMALTNAVLPLMRRQGAGRLVYVSSVGGRVAAMPFYSVYSASKHALAAYAAGLRLEEKQFNILVSLIEPGYTQTTAMAHPEQPRHPDAAFAETRQRVFHLDQAGLALGTPAAVVAAAVARALSQPRPALHHLTGSDSFWMVLLDRLLPPAWFEALIHWMYFQWRPRSQNAIPARPRELGLRWVLFHRPTRDWLSRVAFAATGAAALTLVFRLIYKRR